MEEVRPRQEIRWGGPGEVGIGIRISESTNTVRCFFILFFYFFQSLP